MSSSECRLRVSSRKRPAPLPRQRIDLRPQIQPIPRRQRAAEILPLARRHVELLDLRHLRPAFPQVRERRGDFRDDLAVAAHQLLQVLRRVRRQDFAFEHDHHPVAGHLRLRQDVRRDQDRVARRQTLDQLAHRADLVRVQADGRLVQDDQFRLVHQRIRQADPLAVTLGKLADDPPADLGQAALLHHHVHPLRATVLRLSPLSRARNFRYSRTRMSMVQRVVLRHVTDPAAHLLGLRGTRPAPPRARCRKSPAGSRPECASSCSCRPRWGRAGRRSRRARRVNEMSETAVCPAYRLVRLATSIIKSSLMNPA